MVLQEDQTNILLLRTHIPNTDKGESILDAVVKLYPITL